MEEFDNNRGNKRMAMRTIECLSEIADVTVAMLPGWFTDLPKNVHIEEYTIKSHFNHPQLSSFERSLKHLLEAKRLDKTNQFDYVFFLSYHTAAIALSKIIFKKYSDRIFIFHHYNLDAIKEKPFSSYIFKRYVNKLNQFVFEQFIKDYLVSQYHVNSQKIFVLPHPTNKYDYESKAEKYDCLGISNSNDEKWIQVFIEKEKSDKLFANNNIKMLLRSGCYEYDDGYLKVINGQFTDEEYYGLYTNAGSIILLFPDTFQYRMSGSIVDALSNKKKALLTDIPLFNYYEKRYPYTCKVINQVEDVIEMIKDDNENDTTKELDFDRFINDHSRTKIINCLKDAFDLG